MKYFKICFAVLFLLVLVVNVNGEEVSQDKILGRLVNHSFWMSNILEGWREDDFNTEQMSWFAKDYGEEMDEIYWKVVNNSELIDDSERLIEILVRYRLAILNVELTLDGEADSEKDELKSSYQTIQEVGLIFHDLYLLNKIK